VHRYSYGGSVSVDQAGGAAGAVTGLPADRRPVRPLAAVDAVGGVVPRFRDVVMAQPAALAVADGSDELTFAQVAIEAARVLVGVRCAVAAFDPPAVSPEDPPELRGRPDTFHSAEPVAVLYSHDVWAVAALLGVIASGHPVLVLDPRTPPPRLRQFVERAAVRLVVADEPNEQVAHLLARHVTVPRRDVEAPAADLLWSRPPDPGTAAALAFTSGSTGRPKPVANCHRMLTRDAWVSSVATGCYGADDVIAHTLPMAFHAGLTTTVHGLLAGATMRLYDTRAKGIGTLPGWIAANAATVMIASPPILRAFVASRPCSAELATLRSVNVAGEAAYGRDVEALRGVLPPDCVIRHRYGSSETGMISEYAITADVEVGDGVVPVGDPGGDTRLALVTPEGEPVPAGQTGIVTVTSSSPALGYWGEPEATAASFTDNADGTRSYRTSDLGRMLPGTGLQIVGRADHSVKIRGYLVDPGEVDAALFALPEVREAVVVGLPRDRDGGMRLVAYLVSSAERPNAASIRAALRGALPGHMVPETIVFVPAVPRTDRGKIDRSALPPPPAAVTVVHEEYTRWEELVAQVWADVLELERVGLRDDFFELGGDSLAAEALITRITTDLNVSADVATTGLLVSAPALQDFAARLLQTSSSHTGSLVPLQPAGSRLPLFIVAGGGGLGVAFVPWARRLGPDQPTWALQSPVLEGRGLPDRSVESLARRHLAAVRRVQPNGPYQIAGHSFGGLVAFEMVRQLTACGEEVRLLAILDSFPPNPADHPLAEPVSLIQRVKSTAGLALTALRSTPGGEEHWRFYNQSGDLGRRYRGRPWAGRAVVVVADTPEKEQRARWSPFLTGPTSVVDISGDHLTMTRLPWANEVADVLGEAMAAALAEATAASTTSIPISAARGRHLSVP
jgi:acyl-coenzyme A synthetase/AMP-(fatty) acid ligase/thioesterase domain-containing protein